jgi:signal transduction histidine kinase
MIFWQNNELVFLGCNKNFLEAVNIDVFQNVLGKSSYDLMGLGLEKSAIEQLDTLSKQVIKSDKPYFYTKMELFFYGKKTYLNASFIPLHNAEGDVVGILCSYENVTRKVKAEEERKQLEIHLMHTGRLTAMGEMAAGIAHEMNQPLAIINSASDGLLNYLKGTERHQSAKRIAEQIARATSIIDNMCSFVRVDHGPVKEINLKKPIELALSFFNEQFRIHGILLILDLAEYIPLVEVDPQKFEQIVVNLMINARYSVDQKAKIADKDYQKTVSVSLQCNTSNDALIFKIEDNGIGMKQNVLERCLEPFFTTKEEGEGTGLGLSIAHSIIREFNMKIEIQSSEGKGSRFSILIPIRRKEDDYEKKDSAG